VTVKFKTNSDPNLAIDYRPLELEKEIRGFWDKNRIKEKLMEFRRKNNRAIGKNSERL